MKQIACVISVFLAGLSIAVFATDDFETISLSQGGRADHSCVIVAEDVKCWGNNKFGQTTIPKEITIKKPKQVAVGYAHTCVLDAEGIKCWGAKDSRDEVVDYGQTKVPSLKNPIAVAAGRDHTCVIDAEGENKTVKCWGSEDKNGKHGDYERKNPSPVLRRPQAITAGGIHTCALDENGVSCWGDRDRNNQRVDFGQTDGGVRGARAVSAGRWHTCAIGELGLRCWGAKIDNEDTVDFGQTQVPSLKNPVEVSAGQYHTCAIDKEEMRRVVKCWGAKNVKDKIGDYGQTVVPENLINPRVVSAGLYHTCALDDEGVKCWGAIDRKNNQINVGQNQPPKDWIQEKQNQILFDLAYLDQNFEKMSLFVGRYLESFFKGIASEIKKTPLVQKHDLKEYEKALARYVFLDLAGAVIEIYDSELFEQKVIPHYNAFLKTTRQEMGISSLSSVPVNRAVFCALLEASILALKSARVHLVSGSEITQQEKILSRLGALKATVLTVGYEPRHAKDLFEILNQKDSLKLIEKLAEDENNAGFGVLLQQVWDYLQKQK